MRINFLNTSKILVKSQKVKTIKEREKACGFSEKIN